MDLKLIEKLGSNFYADSYIVCVKGEEEVKYRAKIVKPQFVDDALKVYLHQQLSLLEQLKIDNLPLPEIIDTDSGIILKSEFHAQSTLGERLHTGPALTIEQTIELGISLCNELDKRHKNSWIHRAIKPNNIIFSGNLSHTLLLDDLDVITPNRISRLVADPSYCLESIPYQSPEQCAPVPMDIDYRSDLYSLGCVLYHCIVGQPPFISKTPQKIIHSHLAEGIKPLETINAQCPTSLARILEMLLEKQVEKRYQTALGLKKDLTTCLHQLRNQIDENFTLGKGDFSNKIVLPSLLLGRDHEKNELLNLHRQVCSGQFGVAYISGLSGIGKSRLVKELEIPIIKQNSLFSSGKYNQFSQHQPYATIAQAIGRLIRQILTETSTQLTIWKKSILEVAGINGQILTSVVPELLLLIGHQPDIAPLPPIESRNRFNDIFCRFMNCLATKNHPLVLFIDDLQWCDDATLDLLDELCSHPEIHPYLFLILAFRSNEIDSQHRILKSQKKLLQSHIPFLEIELLELDKKSTNQLTAHILSTSPSGATKITEIIYPTSGGNPLLVSESLRWLHRKNNIYVDDSGQWQWVDESLLGIHLPEATQTLFDERLAALSTDSQEILASAALLGSRFQISDLALLMESSICDLMLRLSEAISQNIIYSDKSELCFFHDQIQNAASRWPDQKLANLTHGKIAQLFIKKLNNVAISDRESEYSQQLYLIAEHLKLSHNETPTDAEKFEAAEFNVQAGGAALRSLAHSAANYYFSEALAICDTTYWQSHYEFMLALHGNFARSELVAGKQEHANEIIDLALNYAHSDLDRAECLIAQTMATTSLGKIDEALELAMRCFELLDCPIPQDEEGIYAGITEHMKVLDDPHFVERYCNLPLASDRKILLEFILNAEVITLFYVSGSILATYVPAMRSMILALKYGKSTYTRTAFITTGIFFYSQKMFDLYQQYEDALIDDVKQSPFEPSSIRAMLQALWTSLHNHLSTSEILGLCQTNIDNGLQAGEINYTGFTYMPLIWHQLVKGDDLEKVERQIEDSIAHCKRFNISSPLEICRGIEAALLPLWGHVPPEHQANVEEKLRQWRQDRNVAALCNFYFYRAMLSYYEGNYTDAEQDLLRGEEFVASLPFTIVERLWLVYRYLVGLHTGNNLDAEAQLEEASTWVKHGPLFKTYLALMQAETTALSSRDIDEVRSGYWRVIDEAHEQGSYFHQAHAYQRLGEVLERANHHSSQLYIHEAFNLYKKCKATFFVDRLTRQHRLPSTVLPANEPIEQVLDSRFLLEATENIMKERNYSQLLLKVLSSIMERVGAKNAYIIIFENDRLTVRAHGVKNTSIETYNVNQELSSMASLCSEIAWFSIRSQSPVILGNALQSEDYCNNQTVQDYQLKSILALPLLVQGRNLGLIYLENSLVANVFNPQQVSLLQVLTVQAAIALDNSLLINNLQKTQETLIEREQNLAITLNSIGDGVIVTDPTGNVLRLNPIAEKLTGWTIQQAKHKPILTIYNIVDNRTHEPLINPVEQALSTGDSIYLSNHTTLIARNGGEYQIADSAAPIRHDDGSILGVVLVFHDVTEAYRLRKELADSHLKLQRVMSDMHSMVATLTPEGKISFLNNMPLRLSGQSSKEVLNKYLWQCFWFKHDKKLEKTVKQACLSAASGQPKKHDIQIQTLNGKLWVDFSVHPVRDEAGNITLLVAEGSDISARKLVEQSLKDEQALQELTLDNLAEAVILSDQDGCIKHFNASACKIFGYHEEEIIGLPINSLIAEAHHASFEDYRLSVQLGNLNTGIDIDAIDKNAEIFPFHIAIAQLPEITHGEIQFVASGQNLTDRVLQQEMLQRSQKMEALGKLTGGIAHDYNNMLGVIQGYCELLQPVLAEKPKHHGFLHQIQHAAERGTKLTKKLLDYSRQKPSKTEMVDITTLLQSQREMLEKILTARIQLEIKTDESLAMVEVNLGDLEDAILNLCINAMHAMPESGRLTIKLKHLSVTGTVANTLQLQSGQYVVLSLTDTGTGMDKETQNKIFDPFFSTKGEQGTGLGLSQVYAFMERSHGTIKVYSELGYGSCLSLYFPVQQVEGAGDSVLNSDATGDNVESLSGTESILVVDDEPALLALMKEVLQNQGYRLFSAGDADEAMNIIKSQNIDLVISDIIMPKTNGYQLATYIQQYDENIIIQLMSGFDDQLNIDDNNHFLHSEQLVKPIKTQTLLKKVKALLDSKEQPDPEK
ncbi:MAG: PAS domain S-box protein [Porticoccaceae bacterium]|nr:PAS domain S-box protein [Porticoccaceae bacterium]